MKPVLFVTNHAPPYRVGAFQRLHELEQIEVALFAGPVKHGGGGTAGSLPFPHRHVREHEVYGLARSGRYRAVVCSTGGRVALPAAWAGARVGRVPTILWASLWAHPRSLAHAFSYVALRRMYRTADAVVTYGPHVSAYVKARGAHNVHVAPQSVDNEFWSSPEVSPPAAPTWPQEAHVKFLFAGRPSREKGLGALIRAWGDSGLKAPTAALVLVGVGSTPPWVPAGGAVARLDQPGSTVGREPGGGTVGSDPAGEVVCLEAVAAVELRNLYAAADVVVVPSIPTPTFREPWGLVVNEAMNRGVPVIASDAVGAAAGGLVRDGHNGLVVPAGDSHALARAMQTLAHDGELRARMGAAARQDVRSYNHDAWAQGFSAALATLGVSARGHW